MPEGPEIRRLRDRLRFALAGRLLTEVKFFVPHLQGQEVKLRATTVQQVESRGKALLIHLDNGQSLYNHNQLYGRWQITRGARPESRRSLRLMLRNAHHAAWLYSASSIEIWPTEDLFKHPFLSRLGPDVLDPRTRLATVLARLQDAAFWRRQLGGILTQQALVAGLGNYLRCEILFYSGLHPRLRPCDLSAAQLRRLALAMLHLPRQSYATAGITNDLRQAAVLRQQGMDFEARRFWVFRRKGLPCYRCGTHIEAYRHGGQNCYMCPRCQPDLR